MRWVKSPVIENYLQRLGIPFEWKNVPYGEFDSERSLKNQARIITTPLVDEVVEKYSIAMMEPNACFPGLVAYEFGPKKLFVDGNHRFAAYEGTHKPTGRSPIGCYILKTDDKLLLSLVTRGINSTNGLPQSKEESIEQALIVMSTYPTVAMNKISDIFGLSVSVLSDAKRARKVEEFLINKKVNTARLTRTSLVELNKLSQNEAVLVNAAEMAGRLNLPTARVKEIVVDLRQKKSESTQLEQLDKIERDLLRFAPRSVERKTTTKSQYFRTVNTMLSLLKNNPTLEHLQLTSKTEIAEARESWRKLALVMGRLFRNGKK